MRLRTCFRRLYSRVEALLSSSRSRPQTSRVAALRYAVVHKKWRSVAVVNKLIEVGADVNARCGNLILATPLHYTVGSGDMERGDPSAADC